MTLMRLSLSVFALIVGTASLLFSALPGANAQPVPWNHPDGSTHWYESIAVGSGIDWDAAQQAARSAGGHLVSITSTAENDFVFSLLGDPNLWAPLPSGQLSGPWIGGVQIEGSVQPAGGWKWLDGEALGYANWSTGQPDNSNGTDDRLHFGTAPTGFVNTWDDLPRSSTDVRGYVIEWEWSPQQTVGLFRNTPASQGGYTLVGASGNSYLIDDQGRFVRQWNSGLNNGFAPYLLDNGDVLRMLGGLATTWAGGAGGRVEQRAWDGTLVWQYDHLSPDFVTHHDVARLPNGNVLMIAWERKTGGDAINQGRNPSLLNTGEMWPDKVIEVQPTGLTTGTIVWEWHAWDHLIQDFDPARANYGVVGNHPERIDINYPPNGQADWHHMNGIDYDPIHDQILLSVREFDEIWVIDHSTTTAEAAGSTGGIQGRGGDILYRWGNPEAYRAGTAQDRKLFRQHTAHWIAPGLPGAGNILLFNNGQGRPGGDFSSADELIPPVSATGAYSLSGNGTYGPTDFLSSYRAANPSDFFAQFVSSAQRLPNGNTFICAGTTGHLFEVTASGETAWSYVNPARASTLVQQGDDPGSCGPFLCNPVFRATRYLPTHPGLIGRDLTPGDPLELYAPEFAARFGSTNLRLGARSNTLLVNGESGDVWRRVYADATQPLSLSVDAPPAGPPSADFLLNFLIGEPLPNDVQVQPAGIGTACMPLPLVSAAPIAPQFLLADTLGLTAVLGPAIIPSMTRAPTTLYSGPLPIGTYTIQGYIIDAGAPSSNVAVTNAIVLTVF